MEQPLLHLGRSCFWRLLVVPLLALLALGCGSSLKERTVSDITVLETSPSQLDTDDALAGLATAAPRKLLWVERERDVYDANLVARDLERIERFYRAHGYYDVKVVAARIESVGERKVEIEILVTPGPRVVVRRVDYPGLSAQQGVGILVTAVKGKIDTGQPFEEQALDRQKRDIETALSEAGFAYAKVRVRAKVDLSARAADVTTEVEAGRRARFGAIRIHGLRQIPENKARALLGLHEGAPYSDRELVDAREALGTTQLFSRVEITPDLSNPEQTDVPIVVTLQEDKLRQLTLGGGTLIDSLKLETHVTTGWEHKNFLGGARRLKVEGSLGVDLFPTRFESFKTLSTVTNWFLVAQTSVKLEQPAIFNGRTKGSAEARFSRRPVLYSLPEGADPRAEVVIGYYTPSGTLALERSFFGQQIYLEPSYNLIARVPFSYQNAIPTGLETVWVSYPRIYSLFQTTGAQLAKLVPLLFDDETKRDLVVSFRNSVEIAGINVGGRRLLGGSLSDVKIEPEARLIFPIASSRWQDEQKTPNLSVAFRAKLGFILAPDYGSTLSQGQATTQADISSPAALSDQQKLLARAFYSGGSNSNRGYASRAISPHGPVGFLLPTRVNCVLNANNPSCIRPLGGFTLWEASVELRFAGLYPFGIVAFADASDVTRSIGAVQFQYPHLSVGPGLRYETPVGPIRLDIGIRVPGLQAIGQDGLPTDPASHGKETPDFFPGAVSLAFNEAF